MTRTTASKASCARASSPIIVELAWLAGWLLWLAALTACLAGNTLSFSVFFVHAYVYILIDRPNNGASEWSEPVSF